MQNNLNIIQIKDESFRKFGEKSWSGRECTLFLTILPGLEKKENLLSRDKEGYFSPQFQKQIRDFTLCELMVSALAFKFEGKSLLSANWAVLLPLLFNPHVSTCCLDFLKQNKFYEKSEKSEVIKEAKNLFAYSNSKSIYRKGRYHTVFNLDFLLTRECLDNFFEFLMIDFSSIDFGLTSDIKKIKKIEDEREFQFQSQGGLTHARISRFLYRKFPEEKKVKENVIIQKLVVAFSFFAFGLFLTYALTRPDGFLKQNQAKALPPESGRFVYLQIIEKVKSTSHNNK